MNDKKFTIQAEKTLSEAIELYLIVENNPLCHSRSDSVHDSLNSLIFDLGTILYPDLLCVSDIVEKHLISISR